MTIGTKHGDVYATAAETLKLGWVRRTPRQGLWLRGTLPAGAAGRVGVVGSRRPTAVQSAFARAIAARIVARGISVFSGGALGIDGEAQAAALDAGGHTVAVLPAGFTPATPPRHAALFEAIARRGGLIACEADGSVLHRGSFFGRNIVLVSAVDALIVVAADQRSGSLHTAGRARAARVPVAAVPWGPTDPNSIGCLNLIDRGDARMLTGLDSLDRWLDELAIGSVTQPTTAPLPGLEDAKFGRQRAPRQVVATGLNIDEPRRGWQRYAAHGRATNGEPFDHPGFAALTSGARALFGLLVETGPHQR